MKKKSGVELTGSKLTQTLNKFIPHLKLWMLYNTLCTAAMFFLDPESQRFCWVRLLWLFQSYGIESTWIMWAGLVLCGLLESLAYLCCFVYVALYWLILFTVYTLNINYWLEILG